ncbi:MAG: hypothetical protein H6555_05815 [Lewinellaceae bacterium]|nr:hypothetical protein [Lewinellaceae bacterium]
MGLTDYVGKGSAILLHDKHKGFGVAETNNISYNTTSFEEETYNSENAEEINLYSFDPLANSLVKAMPSFERSYDNRLHYGQYAHRVKLGKKSSLRGNLSGFTDFTRTQQQTDTRFILNDQARFRQTNDQDTHGSPTFSVIALEWQNELSDSSFLRYNFRHSRKQLRITQQNLQNGNTWFQSQLQTDRSFFYNQAQYSNRISATSLLNIKVSYAQDFFDQSLAVTTTELIPVSGTPGYDALLDTRRQETSIAASYLKKITRGDIEFSLHQNWRKDQFTFLPAGGIPYGFASSFRESKFQSLFNYTLWPKGKVSAQAEGLYADQVLFENGIATLGKQQTWALNSNIRLLITPNPSSKIIVEGTRYSTPPLVQYLHRANIFADSRTFFTNQPGFAWQTTWNTRISFRRDDLTTQSSQHLSVGYQTADNDYLANQEIDSLIFLITWFQFPSNRRTVVGAGGYSFLIDPLSLLISLRGNTSFNWYFTQLNSNVVRKTVNQTSGLQVGINSAFTGVFNFRWRMEGSFLTGTQEDAPPIRNRIWTNELTAHFKWGKNTQFRLTQQAILPEQAFQWRNQLFFDIHINHQIPKKKMECFLMARNIFNRDQYVQVQTTEFSRTVMATSLFRKFLVVGIQLNL